MPTKSEIKLVSWDVDGTLYSLPGMMWQLTLMLAGEIAKGRGLAALKELNMLRRYRARFDAARCMGGALSPNGAATDQARFQDLARRWYGPAIRKVGPRAHVEALLAYFSAQGIPQVVFSDYEAGYKLNALGLKDRFASIYVGERMGHLKPSPQVLRCIAADFGISTANILHIGDRVDRDAVAAREAGAQCFIRGKR
jgi:putative hydrolase of the HAD superfamily